MFYKKVLENKRLKVGCLVTLVGIISCGFWTVTSHHQKRCILENCRDRATSVVIVQNDPDGYGYHCRYRSARTSQRGSIRALFDVLLENAQWVVLPVSWKCTAFHQIHVCDIYFYENDFVIARLDVRLDSYVLITERNETIAYATQSLYSDVLHFLDALVDDDGWAIEQLSD